jgi:DNA ligase-1
MSQSPVYPAARGLVSERGLSLRFPRFYRIREDKSIEQATTPQELADAYERQMQGGGRNAPPVEAADAEADSEAELQ